MRDLLLHSGTLAFDDDCIAFSVLDRYKIVCLISMIILIETQDATESQQEAISQKEIVFRFRKVIQSEKSWRFDISAVHERSRGEGDLCRCASL